MEFDQFLRRFPEGFPPGSPHKIVKEKDDSINVYTMGAGGIVERNPALSAVARHGRFPLVNGHVAADGGTDPNSHMVDVVEAPESAQIEICAGSAYYFHDGKYGP